MEGNFMNCDLIETAQAAYLAAPSFVECRRHMKLYGLGQQQESYKRDHGKQSIVVTGRLANDKSEKKDGMTWRTNASYQPMESMAS